MLPWLPKLPSKDWKRKGSKEDRKDASQEQLNCVKHDNISSPRTPQEQLNCVKHDNISSPRTPRLERSRNFRWHLKGLGKFEDIPRRSLSSFSVASDNSANLERLRPSLSEPVSPSDVDKFVPLPLPPLKSSPESASNSWFLCSHGENSDRDGASPKFSIGSSASSSSKSSEVENVAAGWTGSGLGANAASTFTAQTREKINTSSQAQFNGLDKVMTVSTHSLVQETTEVARPGNPLPVRPLCKAPVRSGKREVFKELVPWTSAAATPIPLRSKGLEQDVGRAGPASKKNLCSNISTAGDPMWVQERMMFRDKSPYQSPRKSPLQSPKKSPLSSPKMMNRAISPQHLSSWNDDLQNAHPLPLPPVPMSPRSGVPSANGSEDSSRVDSPMASARWLWSPGRADAVPSAGKWLKGELLGSGSFGKVYRGHHSETGDMCAIKEVEIVPDDPRSKECAKQLAQEVTLLSMLRHPNILHYKGSEMVGESLYIYLELVSGGSIYRLLQEFNRFGDPVIRRYTRQILLGLQYLHSKNTVHRDIKCANVLVDQDGKVKLADFGMAKLVGKDTAPLSFKGSPYWMAPEVILQNSAGFELAVDIWSLGCTVIEMATGKPPWFQYEGYAAMFKVMNCHEAPIPDSLSPIGQNFVSLCLERDPAKRPSAMMLLEHPFVQIDNRLDSFVRSGMVERIIPKELECLIGMPPKNTTSSVHAYGPVQSAPRSMYYCSSGPVSPRVSHQTQMPTSRSAVLLSNHLRLPPPRSMQRHGQPIEAKEHTNESEGSPSNKSLTNANRNHGWDSSTTPRAYTPKK